MTIFLVHYYECAQYEIVPTAPNVNLGLKAFFVSSSGIFVVKAKISALLLRVLQIHELVIRRLNLTENRTQVAFENFFYALCFFLV